MTSVPAPRLTAKDFPQALLELYDFYAHGRVTKREFLERAARFAVGGVTAAGLLAALSPNYALAQQVSFTDPEVLPEYITYPSPEGHGEVRGYLARPAGAEGPLPGVVVVHENRGLNPYIEDVARRLAVEGFVALAPDGLTPLGGYPGNDDEGRAMQAELDPDKLLEDFMAAYDWLLAHEDTTGSIGVVGFCYGGWVANQMAVRRPGLAAAVPFYGRQPSADEAAAIEAPLMIHYAEIDERVNEGAAAYEAALDAAGKTYEVYVYPGAQHGFHNDTTPRYDEDAAELAWQRTVAFFKEELG